MTGRIREKLLSLIKSLLKEGMSVRKISFCIALGAALGIFPVLGTTTLLCAIAAFALRLNLPAIQIVNYAVYPLQLLLLAPFYSAGNWLFGNESWNGIGENLTEMLTGDFWGNVSHIWDLTLFAVFIWLIISPILVILLYSLLRPVIRSLASSHGWFPSY
jgi:uncharacterized protein (DUF2062 family)